MPSAPISPPPTWLTNGEQAFLVGTATVVARLALEPLVAQNAIVVVAEARVTNAQGITLMLDGSPVAVTARHTSPIDEITRVTLPVIQAEMLAMILGDSTPAAAAAAQFSLPESYRGGHSILKKIAIWNLMQLPPLLP